MLCSTKMSARIQYINCLFVSNNQYLLCYFFKSFLLAIHFFFNWTLIITIWTLIRQYLDTNIAGRRSILWLNRHVDSVVKFMQYHHVMHIFCMPLVMMALAKHRTAMKYNLSSLMFISSIGMSVRRCEELPWCQDVSGNWPILVQFLLLFNCDWGQN